MKKLWNLMDDFLEVRRDIAALNETVMIMERGCETLCDTDPDNKSYEYLRTIRGNLQCIQNKMDDNMEKMDQILMEIETKKNPDA